MNIIDIIEQNTLWQLTGGIHPAQMKKLSNQTDIARLPLASEYLVPLPQVGEHALLAVSVGDRVLKGQPLTRAAGAMYLAAHAPTSGIVTAIEQRPSNHASALPELTCVIEADGLDTEVTYQTATVEQLSNEEILFRIRDAGIAGMGGAMFPSHIKLRPAATIDLLIVNGVECEPYITSDDRLMREHAQQIIKGVEIVQRLVKCKRIIIAIEDNKPEAAAAMTTAVAQNSTLKSISLIKVIPTKYPSGGEKQLIQILTGQEVPSGTIPAQLGIVVHNVGTAFAIRSAVEDGKPLLERVVTVTGGNVQQNGNFWLPIGTPISHVLEQTKLRSDKYVEVIVGGPMMGYTLPNTDVPVLKGTNCLLLPKRNELASNGVERACIRCGECAQVCPVSLLPQQLYWHAKAEEYDKATAFNLQDCIECGCCAFVCPSDIPLVQYYRVAKAAIRKDRAEKVQAEQAKIRFEARLARLEQEKLEREAKAKEASDRRKAAMKGDEKDTVAAALARVQAKKQATATVTPPSNDAIAAAVARAKAKKEQSTTTVADEQADNNKKSAVAAAIAGAKAKKAQTDVVSIDADDSASHSADDKKAQVAAAVARAKAKKAAQVEDSAVAPVAETAANQQPDAVADDKQAKIAAAIARAKAKKQQIAEQNSEAKQPLHHSSAIDDTSTPNPAIEEPVSANADPKKARIAAAVAKAKAKKQASEQDLDKHQTPNHDVTASTGVIEQPSQSESDTKKARIAAAVAKAKAKKQASEQDLDKRQTPEQHLAEPTVAGEQPPKPESDAKKARIAAAVAKAKAKKAAEQNKEQQS